jgi:hypothetical protein
MQTYNIKALAYAVLERAVFDAAGSIPVSSWMTKATRKSLVAEAESWLRFWHPNEANQACSFPWCCEVLELCPFEMRTKIINLLKNKDLKPFNKGRNMLGFFHSYTQQESTAYHR